jgi:arabinose-5-phosphate isomerase
MNVLEIAREVFELESKEILNLKDLLNDDFEFAVNEILKCTGKVIISGMGKSGLVGKKICATLASTGTSSIFVHPAEAFHGDLGMIQKQDVVVLISNSGETNEVLKIIPFLLYQKNIIISMTGNPDSTLATNSNFHLNIAVGTEACPLKLAPTSSTTATMVMGDALAVVLMKKRNFQDVHFAKFHPGGSLGKRLLQNAGSLMKKDFLPKVNPNDKISDVIHVISKGMCGIAVVLEKGIIKGVISDGDIRRSMEKRQSTFLKLKASNLMNKNPCVIMEDEKLNIAEELMNSKKISSLIVVNKTESFVGILQRFDL